MKRGTFRHPKTQALATALGVTPAHALGLLEVLCNEFASTYTPQGDIGRYDDRTIAEGSGWTGDPAMFIEALIAAHYCERTDAHRLVIHDYHEHADEAVRKKLRRKRLRFLTNTNGRVSRQRRTVSRQCPDTVDPPRAGSGTGSGVSSSSEGKKEHEREGEGSRRVALARLTLTPELDRFAREHGCTDPATQLEQCRDYFAGTGKARVDGAATFRNWARKHLDCRCAQTATAPAYRSFRDMIAEADARAASGGKP